VQSGTCITFRPDHQIFNDAEFDAEYIYKIACSRAYLHKGVEIVWNCDESLASAKKVPESCVIHYPEGLKDYLYTLIEKENTVSPEAFIGESLLPDGLGKIEWAINWLRYEDDPFMLSYCNTICTPSGGTHELGVRNAILKGIKNYAAILENKKASNITLDDVMASAASIVSLFIKNPIFQGQTKEKLLNPEVPRLIENTIRHQLEHWLTSSPDNANNILANIISNAEERINRKKSKEIARKTPIKNLRLPGKLTDCNKEGCHDTEIFLVEGDSAGGSAKQARDRENQAILPLKGKILNVASNSIEKIKSNQEICDLIIALGCGIGNNYKEENLRYEKVIIMTDADVDGSHIVSLLLTFFYLQMPQLIINGHLYLAQPPLYKITQGANNYYLRNDREKDKLLEKMNKSKYKFEINRFKGLGEMNAQQLKETTMDPKKRNLLKIMFGPQTEDSTVMLVKDLMGKDPKPRFRFIEERTNLMKENLSSILDI
jgi:topoisomerase IV subunit B